MHRVADGDDAGRVPGAGAEERRAGDVDHLDRLVDAHVASADLGRERLHVDDDDVERLEAVVGELLELLGDVAPGEDAGVDRRVERADLAADERRDRRQVGHRADLDPVGGEMVAGAVGREQLDAEPLELAGESRDALAVGHREQRTHLRGSSSGVRVERSVRVRIGD